MDLHWKLLITIGYFWADWVNETSWLTFIKWFSWYGVRRCNWSSWSRKCRIDSNRFLIKYTLKRWEVDLLISKSLITNEFLINKKERGKYIRDDILCKRLNERLATVLEHVKRERTGVKIIVKKWRE